MIKDVVAKRCMFENDMAVKNAQDEETRKSFMKDLPEFMESSLKSLVKNISDAEFESYYVRSGGDFVQYEIRIEAQAGTQIDNNEVRHSIVNCGHTAAGKWFEQLLRHDAEHIAKLNNPKRRGGGANQYINEGLFCVDNCGELNRTFEDIVKKVMGTDEYVRILFGSEWGKCNVILTITFPKVNN